MSAPFGAPQQGPQAPAPGSQAGPGRQSAPAGRAASGGQADDMDLMFLLNLVAAGAGLVGYLFGFFDGLASTLVLSLPGFALVAAAVLAGLRALPKTPDTFPLLAIFAGYAALGTLMTVVRGSSDVFVIVMLLATIVQLGAVVGIALVELGVLNASGGTGKSASRSGPLPPQQNAQQPQQAQPQPFHGQQGQQPQQPAWNRPQGAPQGAPQNGGWVPASPSQPQPVPAPPGQQPSAWSPGSGGFGVPAAQPGQSSQLGPSGQQDQFGQQGPPGQQGQSGGQSVQGPKGTQQLPQPGAAQDF